MAQTKKVKLQKRTIPQYLQDADWTGAKVHHDARTSTPFKTFFQEIDVPEFKLACERSEDPKYLMLFQAFNNPRLKTLTFGELCRRCKLTMGDVMMLWRNHQVQKGLLRQLNHIPQVMEDIAVDAKSKVTTCVTCEGKGKVTVELKTGPKVNICPECRGDGKTRVIGDAKSRELLFQSTGLKKDQPTNVQTINIGALPAVEDVNKELERIIDITGAENVDPA